MIIASLMVAIKNAFAGLVRRNGAHALVVAAALLAAIPPVGAQTVTALQDTTCAGFRAGSLTCTAGEFTVTPTFAAASGTSPYCIAGQTFTVNVSIGLSGTNANRYNIGFFVGQQGNDPRATTAGNICSAATFPTSPSPFENYDGNACGDYLAGGVSTPIVQSIKVVCAAASGSDLGVPYTLTYNQNTGTTCTGPADVINSSPSKCNAGTATINVGAVPIQVAGYVDLTKVTVPAGDTQSFAFTATGSSSTPSPASFNLTHGATQRIYMPVGSTNSTLTIVESATTNWETTASISCAAQSGSPALTTNGATRTITAQLNTTDKAASCTITNTKKARITLVKAVGGRVVAGDQFTVSASGGGTLTGTTSATTSATGTSASTVIHSTPGVALTLSDAMAAGSTSSIGDYVTSLSCTNAYTGTGATANASLPNNLIASSTSITPAPADDITCTYTNTPKPRVTLQKAIAGTGGRVSATDQFTLTISGATPVTTTGSGSAVTSAAALLVGTAGTAVTLTETAAGSTNLANYATTYSCTNSGTGGTTVASGSGTSFSFTPANNDVIACTFTNTRKSATLRLAKTWVNAVVNDAVSLSATGINSHTFASVANTASETDTDATTMVVAAGETVALAESFTTGVAANYGVSLSCSGNNGALTYTPGSLSGSLAISGADTAISCTFVNSPKPRITLQKALGAGGRILLTDQFTLSMTGAGSVTTTGTGSAVTSSAVSLTGTAGSAITLSESASGTTNLAKYTSTYSCTNSGAGGTTVTPGTGTSFSFTPANNDVIACTFTNTQNVAPTIAKAFSPSSIAYGGTSTITFTITNSNGSALTAAQFGDTLVNMSVSAAGPAGGTCTGASGNVFTAGQTALTITGLTIPASASCTVTVVVTSTSPGSNPNSTTGVISNEAPTGAASNTATLTVASGLAPTISKAFGAATIASGGATSLTFTISNPNSVILLSGINFTDTLPTSPGAMTVANSTVTNTCTGSSWQGKTGAGAYAAPAAGNTALQLSGLTLAAGASCTVSVNITATTAGSYTNTSGAVAATGPIPLTGSTASASLIVLAAPAVTKSFTVSNVAIGGSTTQTITIQNSSTTTALTGVAFTDTYPAGMSGGVGSISGAGCTGTLSGTAGSLTLSGGTIPASTSCTYSVTVTGTAAGAQINSTGAITSSNAPNGSAASATLNVYTAPTVTKTFSPAMIATGGTSSLSIVVTNPAANPGNLSGVSINDAYTGTLSNNAAGSVSCSGGGSATLSGGVNGGTSVGFTSGTIVPGGSCTITQSVTASSTNTNATNAPTATGPVALTGTAATGVVLTVSSQPTIAKSFAASQVALGGSVNMSFQITNPNPTSLSGLAFNDSLPAGLTAGNGTTASCGGSMVISGGNTLSFSGGTLAASASCTITVAVTGSTAGVKNNTTGVISSNESGAGTTSNTATVTVLAPLTISKTFAASDIALGGSTTLTITISNANGTTAISGVSFTDPLPSGLTAVNGSSVFCGGTLTVSGGNLLSFSGGSVAAGGSCVITVTVTGATAGAKANTTTAVNASGPITLNGAASNTATVNVYAPPTISKAFAVGGIALNASTKLNITVSNPNAGAAIGGISFTDPLPAGLTAVNGSSSACGGTLTVSGTNLLSFSGGTLAAGASCVIGTTITGSSSGVKANTTTAVSAGSPIALAGAVSNTANLTVSAPPTISKSFASANVALGGSVNMSFVISNPNSTSLSGIAVTDTLPAGLSAANGSSATCGGSLVVSGNNLLSFSGGTLAGNASCTITVAVTGIAAGIQNNTTGAVSSSESGAGATSNTATVNVAGAPTIVKSFAAPTVALGGNVNMSFVISNPNIFGLSGLAFGDTLPAGLSAVNGTAAVCGGSLVTSGANTLTFTGGTLAAGASCTITVAVTGIAAGVQNNTTSAISSTESGSGAVSNTATVTVLSPPTLAKSFAPATIGSGGVTTLTITISNPNSTAITVGGLVDTFPTSPGTGLVRAATPNAATTCSGGSETSTAGSVTLSGGTVPANGSCTVQIDVSAASSGSYINTIAAGALSSSAGSNAAAASATLTVTPVANVSVTKSGPATIAWGSTITYTAVVSNAGPDAANSTVFSDAVPASISGVSASCGSATGGAVCGAVNLSGNNVSSIIASLPAGASLTFTIQGTTPQTGTLSNSASAIVPSGISDPDDPGRTGAGNNTSAAVSTIVQAPDLRLVKTSASNFTVGSTAVFTLTVSNSGNAPTSGTITVVDTLPTGLSYNAAGSGGTGWSCSSSGQVVTCTSGDVIAAAGSGNPIAINVGISSAAAPGVTNVANVAGGNEPAFYAGNNGALLTVSVVFPGGNTFNTDGVQSGLPGTALFYPHTFKAGLGGSVGFSTTDTASPPISGWGVTIFRDVNCNGALDGTEGNTPMSGSVAVVPGDQVCIVVKSTIPATAAYNSQDTIAVAANFTPTSGAPSTLLRQDVTTVGPLSGAGLTLAKSVRNVTQGGSVGTSNSARPGDTLEYIIVYTNTTNGAISTIVISDAVPAFTGYVSGNCVTPLPAVLTGCAVTTAPAVGAAGNIQWTLSGPLNPNTSGSVLFRVVVQ